MIGASNQNSLYEVLSLQKGTFENLGEEKAVNMTIMGKSMIVKESTGGIFFSLRRQLVFPMQGPL